MRVALVNLTHGGLSGGYLKYLERLVPRLSAHPAIADLGVFVPDTAVPAIGAGAWMLRTFPARHPGGIAALKHMVRDCRPDLVFIPTASWVDFGGVPVVVMVRNMEPLEIPFGGNPPAAILKNLARRSMARRACRHATRIIAVSNHVRSFLTTRWSIDPAKVAVVYHGVGGSDVAPVRANPLQGIGGRFLFTAGSIRPARGLIDLIGAMERVRESARDLVAVVAGGTDAGMERHAAWLSRRAAKLGIADRIVMAGKLNAGEMRWCYEQASAFVMTSRAEACPNVALEAMSHGCACISVDRPPMPEFFENTALYYRTGDAGQLADAIVDLMQNPDRARQLRTAAVARAAQFAWDTTALRTVAELQTALRAP